MTFRISGRSSAQPDEHFELTDVTLHVDEEGLRDLHKFLQDTVADFDRPTSSLDHYHLRDSIHTSRYHEQQRDMVSKDVLILPYRTK